MRKPDRILSHVADDASGSVKSRDVDGSRMSVHTSLSDKMKLQPLAECHTGQLAVRVEWESLSSTNDQNVDWCSKKQSHQCRLHVFVRELQLKLKIGCICPGMFKLTRVFTVDVRSLLENGSCIWSPYFKSETDRIESVQRRFTKRFRFLNHTVNGWSDLSWSRKFAR